MNPDPGEIARLYRNRFRDDFEYRFAVWTVLVERYFGPRFVLPSSAVLDLGAGFGEFILNVCSERRVALDFNQDAAAVLADHGIEVLIQDCAERWPLADSSLDVVFSSNLLEHLPSKVSVVRTLSEGARCLRPGGHLVLMGPNFAALPRRYWDFWDHHVALTDRSVSEAVRLVGLQLETVVPRFLPYSMSQGFRPPAWTVRLYLRLRLLWPVLGKQFLVVARKP